MDKFEAFTPREIKSLCKIMSDLACAYTGIKVHVEDTRNGLGFSLRKDKAVERTKADTAIIGINFNDTMVPEKKKREIVMYGVFAHELMHLLLTDFSLSQQLERTYPARERSGRHQMANIVEDPAIEGFAPQYLGEFLTNCLRMSISIIYENSEPIEQGSTPYEQFIIAMIQFGDLGSLIGKFTFNEAKKVFYDIVEEFDRAIDEPVFKKRWDISMDIFEKSRALWEDQMSQEDAMRKLAEILEKYGKSDNHDCSGNPLATSTPSSSGSDPSDSSERRKITVRVIKGSKKPDSEKDGDKDASGGPSPDAGNDNFGSDNNSGGSSGEGADEVRPNDPSGSKDNHDGTDGQGAGNKGAKETEAESESDSGSGTGSDESGTGNDAEGASGAGPGKEDSDEPSGSNDGNDGVDGNAQSGSKEGDAADGTKDSDAGSDSSDTDREPDESSGSGPDEQGAEGESKPKDSKGGSNEQNSAGEEGNPSGDNAGNEAKSNHVGHNDNSDAAFIDDEQLQELLSQLQELLDVLEQQARDFMQEGEEAVEREEQRERERNDEENVDISPSSPYIKRDIRDHNVMVEDGDLQAYESIKAGLSSYITGLYSSLKHIFNMDRASRSYKKSGKLNVKRVYGTKVTARLFTKNSLPGKKNDMAVIVLVDESGSMQGQRIITANKTSVILAEVLAKFDIPVKVIGFASPGSYDSVQYHYGGWKNSIQDRARLTKMGANGGTFLGYAMRYSSDLLKRRQEQHKILIVITDGGANSMYYRNMEDAYADIMDCIKQTERFGNVVGIGLFDDPEMEEDYKKIFGSTFLPVNNLSEMPLLISRRFKEIVKKW